MLIFLVDKFVACACNVGDSLAYVYSTSTRHVREITQGSHDIQSNRDMRDALGALGPVDGVNPELSNLTCSMTQVEAGDIVFLTSDGISDNFDPVVGKFCVPQRQEKPNNKGLALTQNTNGTSLTCGKEATSAQTNNLNQPTCKWPQPNNNKKSQNQQNEKPKSDISLSPALGNNLPAVAAYQRHELTLLRMEDLLNHGSGSESALPSNILLLYKIYYTSIVLII